MQTELVNEANDSLLRMIQDAEQDLINLNAQVLINHQMADPLKVNNSEKLKKQEQDRICTQKAL